LIEGYDSPDLANEDRGAAYLEAASRAVAAALVKFYMGALRDDRHVEPTTQQTSHRQ
jgi:hypothetical protein